MLRRNTRAANEPRPQRKVALDQFLRARVVTQQNFFVPPLCHRPGCHEPPRPSLRTKAHYCSHACCEALRRVRDREAKWQWRGTLDGCAKRQHEYRAARDRRSQADCQADAYRQPRGPPT